MNGNFDNDINRFSETAEKILRDSQMIASAMASGPDTEHLLTALASNPGTFAFEVLQDLLVNPERISAVLTSKNARAKAHRGVSSGLKQVFKTAYRKAVYYGTPTVDSEHLLLALVSLKDSNAYHVLSELGVDPLLVRGQLEDYFDQLKGPSGSEMLEERNADMSDEDNPSLDSMMPQTPIAEPDRGNNRPKTAIDYFTIDLTKKAKNGELDPVVGRSNEIRRMTQILVRRIKNNPVLTGEPGVGKTAIVEGLAGRIAAGEVPAQLLNKRVLMLDLALLISGTTYRGQFEERTKKLIDEILKNGNIILFIDELHTIVGAGAAEGSLDLSNIFKPALAKGQLSLIGATTNDEYRKYIERDPALERRLQRVMVNEPSSEEAIEILEGLKGVYEEHHHVTIDREAILAAVDLSKRYINDRYLPDKAIDLIDEAAAAVQLEEKWQKLSNKVGDLERQHKQAGLEHQKAAESFDYKTAAEYRVLEIKLLDELNKLRAKLPKKPRVQLIGRENIERVVAQWTGVPVTTLERSDKLRLSNLEGTLKSHIVGQGEAITTIAAAIKRSSTGVGDPKRPLGSFIFLGPTGVGKTELVKVLAKEVYGREEALVKIDMSEFMERHNVSRLVGAPPGYVGYEDAGKLTETIRRQPYSVVLLDEIEKAHPDVFNMLLQIMEDGYLTDAKGRRVNFRNTILVMTSNIGMAELNRQAAIGFKTSAERSAEEQYQAITAQIVDKLKDHFRPEFLNRLDKVVIFKPLGKKEIANIVELQLQRLVDRLAETEITLIVEDSAKELIAEKGFEPEFGARPIRRSITELIEDPLSDLLLAGKLSTKTPIRVLRKGDKLAFAK
jgi:ATP-dependent Clp protease ATP-binding subunit ClpC